MTTVKDLLLNHAPAPLSVSNGASNSTKQWADEFPRFEHVTYHGPGPMEGLVTFDHVHAFLGPNSETPSTADHLGLATPAHRPNHPPQYVENEGDVARVFYQDIIAPVALAFSGPRSATSQGPGKPLERRSVLLNQRSESGVPGATHKVDFQMVMPHSNRPLSSPAIIGEFKKPGSIVPSDWRSLERGFGMGTRALQKELRGYAWKYHCPQVFVFDGDHLVLVQFRAESRDDIKSPDCQVDICVISRPLEPQQNIPTMQYALYCLCWTGFRRLCGTLGCRRTTIPNVWERASLDVRIDNLYRDYVYFSGEPCWYDSNGRAYQTPRGWKRDFDWGRLSNHLEGYWYWTNGRDTVRDTENCFIWS